MLLLNFQELIFLRIFKEHSMIYIVYLALLLLVQSPAFGAANSWDDRKNLEDFFHEDGIMDHTLDVTRPLIIKESEHTEYIPLEIDNKTDKVFELTFETPCKPCCPQHAALCYFSTHQELKASGRYTVPAPINWEYFEIFSPGFGYRLFKRDVSCPSGQSLCVIEDGRLQLIRESSGDPIKELHYKPWPVHKLSPQQEAAANRIMTIVQARLNQDDLNEKREKTTE